MTNFYKLKYDTTNHADTLKEINIKR